MNKIILSLIAVVSSLTLCGCTPATYSYKGHANLNSIQILQMHKADSAQAISAVKPIENWVAKSAVIIVPDRKICQILIINKTFITPNSAIDTLAEINYINFNARAEQIAKRNIFEITKKAQSKEDTFETKKYDYIIWVGSKIKADLPPQNANDFTWWIKNKNGKNKMKIETIISNNEEEITSSFLQQIEDFVIKTEAIVKGINRFDTAKLKNGINESELTGYYGSIKETVMNDPFASNIKYKIILFEALPSLNSKTVNGDKPFTAWAMFHNDKAIAFGAGKEKEAKHSIYSALVNKKYASGKLKQSQAERMIFNYYRQLYGEPEPITKEIAMFRIMLAEKIETKKISQSEADYFMAQKESEIAARLKEMQIREERRLKEDASQRALIELQQRQIAYQHEANAIAQRQASSQALMGVANFMNQQAYQQQLIQSLNRPFNMNCWSNGNYTNCQSR